MTTADLARDGMLMVTTNHRIGSARLTERGKAPVSSCRGLLSGLHVLNRDGAVRVLALQDFGGLNRPAANDSGIYQSGRLVLALKLYLFETNQSRGMGKT